MVRMAHETKDGLAVAVADVTGLDTPDLACLKPQEKLLLTPGRVLIAEDHNTIGETYKLMLELEGYDVLVCPDGQDCIEKFDEAVKSSRTISSQHKVSAPFEILVVDYHLPRKDGIEIIKYVHSLIPHQRIIIASSYPKEVILQAAESLNHSIELLTKPFDLTELVDIVTKRKSAETIGVVSQQFKGQLVE